VVDLVDERSVLVCGLGTLGEECCRVLKVYGVEVRAVDIQDRPEMLEVPLVRGDCRDVDVLRQAGARSCRAVVLVTGDSRANVEGALAARHLNPSVRIVARTGEHNISELLSSLLGNFVGYEPNQLAAGALALAALRAETVGYFRLEGRLLRVIRHRVRAKDGFMGRRIREVSSHRLVVLEHLAPGSNDAIVLDPDERSTRILHNYDPEGEVRAGDTITFLAIEGAELDEDNDEENVHVHPTSPQASRARRWRRPFRAWGRTTVVAVGGLAVVVVAVSLAAIFFPASDHSLSKADGIFTALVLMTGGTYADLFPAFHQLSNALRLFSVTLSVIGTLAVGLVYAWLTDRLMTFRLRLSARRPEVPHADHVLIVGLGGIGRQAAALFQTLRRPAAGIESGTIEEHALPGLAVIAGSGTDGTALSAAGIERARGLLATTGSDWQNLETALVARTLNPDCSLVIRTSDRRFSNNVAGILPRLSVVCVPVVAAKAFAAAALGQNVLNLFQLDRRTIFVVEHDVRKGDGFDGKLLNDIAEGYSVMPVLHQPKGETPRFWSIVDRAAFAREGDRIILLGPSTSLQMIERGEMGERTSRVRLCSLRSFADRISAAAILSQQLACTLEQAQSFLGDVPITLPDAFYPLRARRLEAALEQAGVEVEVTVS
jgi:Trk K+ transport system NAD-binding subunit